MVILFKGRLPAFRTDAQLPLARILAHAGCSHLLLTLGVRPSVVHP